MAPSLQTRSESVVSKKNGFTKNGRPTHISLLAGDVLLGDRVRVRGVCGIKQHE